MTKRYDQFNPLFILSNLQLSKILRFLKNVNLSPLANNDIFDAKLQNANPINIDIVPPDET